MRTARGAISENRVKHPAWAITMIPNEVISKRATTAELRATQPLSREALTAHSQSSGFVRMRLTKF